MIHAPSAASPPPAVPAVPRTSPAELHRVLCGWFASVRRDLPWRRTRDPYAVWISEAMLQQTRVETVVPYFTRFLARFPDVAALAAAREEDVLAAWSGLGYYRRARALRAAAAAIVARHGGAPPRTRAEWLALPGVGPYTAGAVLSIAFSQPEALVDGNVQRVLARLFALAEPVGSKALAERAWEHARALVPPARDAGGAHDPGDWNQALMELGATLCTPRAPRCGECPLAQACAARAAGRAEELPVPAARRAPIDVRLEVLAVRGARGWLLAERAPRGRMAGMLEPPTREIADGAPRLWPAELPHGLAVVPGAELGTLSHAITHHRIRATVRAAELARAEPPAGVRWARPEEHGALALTGLARKAAALAFPALARAARRAR